MSDFNYTIRNNQSKVNHIELPDIDDYNACFLRSHQIPAYEICANKRFSRLCMPTGSGKSTVLAFLIIKYLTENPKCKAIIAVPQLSIAKSHRHFAKGKHTRFFLDILPDNLSQDKILQFIDQVLPENAVDWSINTDLTDNEKKTESSTVRALVGFLKGNGVSISSRICLCSHQTLVAAYRQLDDDDNLDIFNNVMIAIDEYHHVREIVKNDDELENDDENEEILHGLGEVADFIFSRWQTQNLSMCMLSATPMRGDMARIVSEQNLHLFEDSTYILPFDEYMSKMSYLKSFEFIFECYPLEDGFAPVIQSALKDNKFCKTMIWLPKRQSPGNPFTTSNKKKEINEIMIGIARSHGWMGEIVVRNKKTYNVDSIVELQIGDDRWVTIVNVVDDDVKLRKPAKKFLDSINDNPDQVDYIIALEMLKEGFDWKFCDRTISLGKNNSLNQLLQIPGRALRDVPNKSHVQIRQYLPIKGKNIDDAQKLEDNINDVVNAIHLSMLMYEIHEPIDINLPSLCADGKKKTIKSYDLLDEVFGNDEDKFDFNSKYQAEITQAIINKKDDLTSVERKEIIENILGSMGIDDEIITKYSDALLEYTHIRAKRVMPMMLESLSKTRILQELRGMIKPMSPIPAELYIAAFHAQQINANSLREYHAAMYKLNSNENEASTLENLKKVQAFYNQHNRMPDPHSTDQEEASLGEYVEKVRKKKCHRERAIKVSPQMA
jgi:hypothetical protein